MGVETEGFLCFFLGFLGDMAKDYYNPFTTLIFGGLRWLERVLVFVDALYLGVKIFRLELANHDQILPQNNDNISVNFL